MSLDAAVLEVCQRYGKQHCWIALSGGLDSRVLLDVCHTLRAQTSLQFQVIHVHHGLSPFADDWARQCEQWCVDYGFKLHTHYLKLENVSGDSLEETARNARYAVFAKHIQPDDLLLTAHHQDDQAETVLLQLLRGAGPKGLAAMPRVKNYNGGWHARPLLAYIRADILAYATEHHLQWVDDESNANRSFTRNFLRHEIMPILKDRWPGVEKTLARSAMHCAEAQALLEDAAAEKLPQFLGSRTGTLSSSKLKMLSEAWQRLLLRTWIADRCSVMPDTNKILSIQKTVLASAHDRTPIVGWTGAEVRRQGDDIYLLVDQDSRFSDDLLQGLKIDAATVTQRVRVPGETVELGARGRVSLKNLFQEWQVPTWERGTLPLLFCGARLIKVPGYYLDSAYFF